MSDVVNQTPYDGEELMAQAAGAARALNIPEARREDAEAEYVLGALEAVHKNDRPDGIRAFQQRCGRDAMLKFVRREIRHERLSPGKCRRGAERISLDLMVPDEDGRRVPLAGTIPDPATEAHDSELERGENDAKMKADVRRALNRLDPALAAVAVKVLIEGGTQEDVAEALGITRDVLRTRLSEVRRQLQEALSDYRDEYSQTRIGKK